MTYLQKKKLAFMSIVNSVKGFVRSVVGIPPLTLHNCVDEDSLISYKLYGDSLGEYDENTGKYKIPIKARGKNLFYSKSFSSPWRGISIDFDEESQVLTLNGTLAGSSGTIAFEKINNFTLGSGTISIKEIGGSVTGGNNGLFVAVNKAYSLSSYGRIKLNTVTDVSRQTGEMSDCKYIVFYFNGDRSGIEPSVYDNYKIKIQIEQGAKETEYEEYAEPIITNIYLDEPLVNGDVLSYPKNNIPKLPTLKGTTIYEVDTSIQPSNMEAVYYSTQKGD